MEEKREKRGYLEDFPLDDPFVSEEPYTAKLLRNASSIVRHIFAEPLLHEKAEGSGDEIAHEALRTKEY